MYFVYFYTFLNWIKFKVQRSGLPLLSQEWSLNLAHTCRKIEEQEILYSWIHCKWVNLIFCSVYMHYSDYFTVKRRLVRGPPSCLLWWSCINAIKWCQEIFYSNPGQNSINGSKKKMRMSELLLSRCEVPRAESHQLSPSWLKGLRMHLWRD